MSNNYNDNNNIHQQHWLYSNARRSLAFVTGSLRRKNEKNVLNFDDEGHDSAGFERLCYARRKSIATYRRCYENSSRM